MIDALNSKVISIMDIKFGPAAVVMLITISLLFMLSPTVAEAAVDLLDNSGANWSAHTEGSGGITSHTYTAPAGSNRVVVVVISGEGNSTSISSVTVGGSAATEVTNQSNSSAFISVWYRPIGSSGSTTPSNISVTWGTSPNTDSAINAATYSGVIQTAGNGLSNTINSIATGSSSAFPFSTNTSVFNASGGSVNNVAGGRVLYAVNANQGSTSDNDINTGTSSAWTFSEMWDVYVTSNRTAAGHSNTASGSATVSINSGSSTNRAVLIAFAMNPLAGDTLTATRTTDATSATQGNTDVRMERINVDCTNNDDGSAVIRDVTVDDLFVSASGTIDNLKVYVDDDTNFSNGTLGSVTTSTWNGQSTTVDLTSISAASRTVTCGTTLKYLWINYDLNASSGGSDIQARVTAVGAVSPDSGVSSLTLDSNQITILSCVDSDPTTSVTINPPTSGSTIGGVYTVQAEVAGETTPGDVGSSASITTAGTTGGTCDVTGAAMSWNSGASRWEYDWNTSSCGDPAESGITVDVSYTDPNCGDVTPATQVTNITIDNTDPYSVSNCGSCHNYPPMDGSSRDNPTGAVVGSHSVHVNDVGLECTNCHIDNGNMASAFPQGPGHRTGIINMTSVINSTSGSSYSKGTSFAQSNSPVLGTCSNTYCHSSGIGGTNNSGDDRSIPANSTPTWGGSTDCESCHGKEVADGSGQPAYANATLGAPGTLKRNSHTSHPTDCSYCHDATTSDGGNSITGLANHVNRLYNVIANASASFSYTYAVDGGTCNSISCHGSGNAKWGSTLGCMDCHNSAISVAYNTRQVVGAGGDFVRLSRHVSDGTGTQIVTNSDCVVCHAEGDANRVVAGTGWVNSTNHMNGSTSTDRYVKLRNVDNIAESYDFNKNFPGSAAEDETMRTNMDTFCMNCHDSDGASAIAVTGAGATNSITLSPTSPQALAPFNDNDTLENGRDGFTTRTRVIDVKDQFNTANPSQHGVRGQRYSTTNSNWNASSGVAWTTHALRNGTSMRTAGEVARLHCSDCHLSEVNAHGAQNAWHMLMDGVVNNYTNDTAMGGLRHDLNRNINVCYKCHSSTIYQSSPTAGISRLNHDEDSDWDQANYGGTGGNDQAYLGMPCLNCHGGDGFGHIHGRGSATDGDSGTYTSGSGTYTKYRFMPGAWMRWKPGTSNNDTAWTETSGSTCYFQSSNTWSACTQHSGSSRSAAVNYGRATSY